MAGEGNPLVNIHAKPQPPSITEAKSNINKPASLLWTPLLVLGFTIFAVEIPFFFYGTPSGHDVEFHLYSWLEVAVQWKQGILYPRWASLANFGYGEPRFLFYPPASWMLGTAISSLFPWTLASSIYIWIVLMAAGVSMFLLARRWLDRRGAIFAAAFYAVNPYHLVIVYWRSAFAELLASCLLPLLLLLLLKATEDRHHMTVPLAFVLAAAWLTNAPAALMIHYSFALLIVLLTWRYGSPRFLWMGVTAVGIGACLAAFYLLPAIYEQRWIDIAGAVSAGSRPSDNFLFIHTGDAPHDAFNHLISWVAVAEMASILAILIFAVAKVRKSRSREGIISNNVWIILAIWAAICGILMLPVTSGLWSHLPKLQFMQFPWRWMLCLSMIFSLLVTLGMRRWWARGAMCLGMLLIVFFVGQRTQPPWWDTAADLRELQDNVATNAGYEGTDEYTPVGTEPSAIDKDARNVIVDGSAHAAIRVLRWSAESKSFIAEMSESSKLALRLLPYPAWRVEVNGHRIETVGRAATGQMLVPVAAGLNQVQITFVRTWDRKLGTWISWLSVILILAWSLRATPGKHSVVKVSEES